MKAPESYRSDTEAVLQARRAELARLLIVIEGYNDFLCAADAPHEQIKKHRDITIRRRDRISAVIMEIEAEMADDAWPDLPPLKSHPSMLRDLDKNLDGMHLARAEIVEQGATTVTATVSGPEPTETD